MKEISAEAGLFRTYTNHSVRATAITLWANAGLTDREIMAISGHRNEASLRSYHNQPSVNQLRKCSDVLTVALCEDEGVQPSAVQQIIPTRSPFQQLPCTSSTMNMNSISTGMAPHSTVATSTAYSNIYALLTKREVKMAGYWLSSFFAFLWTETKSRSIKTQKKNEANIQSS